MKRVDFMTVPRALAMFANTPDTECWPYPGTLDPKGYGSAYTKGTRWQKRAHRIAYEMLVGPVPKGLELDHLCRNRACINPKHLEPVTHAENMRRGKTATKTHCPKGHPYNAENTRYYKRTGKGGSATSTMRVCRACVREATWAKRGVTHRHHPSTAAA